MLYAYICVAFQQPYSSMLSAQKLLHGQYLAGSGTRLAVDRSQDISTVLRRSVSSSFREPIDIMSRLKEHEGARATSVFDVVDSYRTLRICSTLICALTIEERLPFLQSHR